MFRGAARYIISRGESPAFREVGESFLVLSDERTEGKHREE